MRKGVIFAGTILVLFFIFSLWQNELSDPYLYRKTSTYKRVDQEGTFYPDKVYLAKETSPNYPLRLLMVKEEEEYRNSLGTKYGILALFVITSSGGLLYFGAQQEKKAPSNNN